MAFKGSQPRPTGPKPKPPSRREVAGPYRGQSSVPSVRAKATPREHRTEPATVGRIQRQEARQARRIARRAVKAVQADQRQALRKARRIGGGKPITFRAPTKHVSTLESIASTATDAAKTLKSLGEGSEARQSSAPFLKHYAEGEVKNLGEALKESGQELAEGRQKPLPSQKQTQAALTIASLGGVAGPEAGVAEKGIAKALSGASYRTTAEKAARAVTGGVKARAGAKVARIKGTPARIRTAPARATRRIKETPGRVKSAPGRAKTAATTKAGRRAAAKGGLRRARRHKVRTGYGATVILPEGALPGDATKRARAALEGSASAIYNHPIETAETTARSLPAAIVGPAEILGAAGSSIKHGSLKPLENTVSEQAQGVGHILGQTFSGDAKKAEMAARKEGSLALATGGPALTRLPGFKRAKGAIREGANTARRKVAAKGDLLNAKVRHSPEGTQPHVTGFGERRAERKKTALIKQRIDNPHRVARERHGASIEHAAAKMPHDSYEALQVLAEYGARDPRHIQLLRDHGPKDKALLQALDILERHPEVWQHKGTKEALAATKAASESNPAGVVGKGERARLLPQGDLLGIPRPEHRIPHAKREEFGGVKTWQEAVERADKIKVGHAATERLTKKQVAIARSGVEQARKTRNRLHERAGRRLSEGEPLRKAEERDLMRSEGTYRLAQRRAKKARADLQAVLADGNRLKELRKEAVAATKRRATPRTKTKWVTVGGKKVKKTFKIPAYDNRISTEYKREVEAARKAQGLAPAIWTHHAPKEQPGAGLEGTPGQRAPMAEHMREGSLAKADNLDRSLEGLIRGTVHLPRQREAARQFMRAVADQGKTAFMLDGKKRYVIRSAKDWKAITTRKTKENPNGGQVDPKSYGRLALREWNGALNDPFMGEAERTQILLGLLDEAEKGHVKGHEPSLLVPREMIKEARAQLSPQHHELTKAANLADRGAIRALLGTNPAWFLAQIPAVGIAAVLSEPRLLNPIYAGRIYHEILRRRKTDPEGALAMEGAAGAQRISSSGLRTPLDMQEALTPVEWARGAKALTRGKPLRTLLSFAKLEMLAKANARFEGELRQVVYAMKADRQFRAWHKSVTGLFDTQAELSKRFRNQPHGKLWAWLEKDAEGKRYRFKLEDQMDGAMGNWTAFTRFERSFAPLAIFYGFLRYSLRWTAWTFPRDHPINATMAYMLGQANANQIEKLVGQAYFEEGLQPTNAPARPSNPLAFAMPVYSGPDNKKSVMPGGTRISPGQSSLTQALGSGNPAAILSSANPAIAAAIVGLTGIEPFTGEKTTKPKGWAALEQITGLPYPLRARLPFLGNQNLSEKALQALGAPSRSPASEAYEALDKSKNLRSGVLPFLPQTAADFKATEGLSKGFDLKYGKNAPPSLPAEYWEAAYNHDWKLAKKLRKEVLGAERGSEVVKANEEPHYGPSKPFDKEAGEILQFITGKITIPVKPKAKAAAPGGAFHSTFGSGGGSGSGSPYQQVFGG